MIRNPYLPDESDLEKIAALIANGEKDIWSDSSVDELRSKIKKHYIREQNYRCCYCGQML